MALAPVTDEEQSRILQLTVAAIGGPEEDENGVPHYSKGDECLGEKIWAAGQGGRGARRTL